MHELSLSSAIVNTVVKHADGRPVTRRAACASGALRQVVPDTLDFYFGFVARGHRLRGRAARAGARSRRGCAARRASASGRSTCRSSAARAAAARPRSRSSAATSSRSSRSRSRRPHASHKGEGRRGGAGRQQHDRAGEPGRLRSRRRARRQLHERARGRQDRRCSSACWPTSTGVRVGRARGRRAGHRWTPTASPLCTFR